MPEGQGVLFPEAVLGAPKVEPPAADSNEVDDGTGEEAHRAPGQQGICTPRKPRTMDMTGLPREDRLHDVPERSASIGVGVAR